MWLTVWFQETGCRAGRVNRKRGPCVQGADSDQPLPRAPETHLPRPSERSHRSTAKCLSLREQFPSPWSRLAHEMSTLSFPCKQEWLDRFPWRHSIPWCLRNPRTEGRGGWACSWECCRIACGKLVVTGVVEGSVWSRVWKCPEQPTSSDVDFKGHLWRSTFY